MLACLFSTLMNGQPAVTAGASNLNSVCMTPDQLKALYWLPFYELAALRDVTRCAIDAYQFGALESANRLIGMMQTFTGPFPPRYLVWVSNQITIVWVERTPGLAKQRLSEYGKI